MTVVHGLGQGDYYPGERVQLTADTPQAGFAFDQWVCTAGDGTLEETQSPNAVFVMGSQAATVEARYKQTAAATPTPEPSSTPEGAPTPGASPLPSPTPTPSGEAAGGNPQTGDTTPTHAVWASILLALALGAIGMSGRGRRRGIQ